jgi:hypothetical protein
VCLWRIYICIKKSPSDASSCSASREIFILYGIRKFTTVFTRAHNWSLSWTRWIQSTISLPVSRRSIWCFPSMSIKVFKVVSSLQSFRLKFVMWGSSPANLIFLNLITLRLCEEEYKMQISLFCSFASLLLLSLLRSEYFHQHPLKHRQTVRSSPNVTDQDSQPYNTTVKL